VDKLFEDFPVFTGMCYGSGCRYDGYTGLTVIGIGVKSPARHDIFDKSNYLAYALAYTNYMKDNHNVA